MSQNLSETQFHYVIRFVSTQQLLKSPHLLMESGDVQVKLFQLLVDMKVVQLNHEVKKTRN